MDEKNGAESDCVRWNSDAIAGEEFSEVSTALELWEKVQSLQSSARNCDRPLSEKS